MSDTQKHTKRNVPNLRFPGFEGEWEKHYLSEYLEFKNGLNPSANSFGEGIKFISVMDILNNPFITYDCIRAEVSATEKEKKDFCIGYGDIVFQRSSETLEDVGHANVYLDERPALFGGFTIRGKKKGNYNPLFFKYLLDSPRARKKIIVKGAGAQHFNIGQDGLSTVYLCFPSLPEQSKIANLISLIDQRIAIQNKVIKESIILKKVLCQRLFDSSKKSVSLASIADIEMGQSPDSSAYNRDSLGIPLIQGNLDIKDGNTVPSIWTTQITKKCEIGDVILTVRAPVGEVAISSHNACIGRGVCGIHCGSSTLGNNIFQYLSFFSDWGRFEQGSTFTAINRKDIEKISIPILSPRELLLLSNIDEHLRLSKELLRKYYTLKDYCLKQLFV